MTTSGVHRTLLALLASALGAIPLLTLISDAGWLIDAWLSMLVVVVPALLLRLRRPPGALQIWPGVVLLVPWLTARFLSDTAWYGFIPTDRSWHRLSVLLAQLHDTMAHDVAPVHSSVPIEVAVCAVLGLLAALVDLIAVVARHGALAGIPLLVVYTAAGAVPHRPVSWLLFLAPAVGFLVLLGLDANDDRAGWGHRVTRSGSRRAEPAGALSGQRIALLTLLVAVVVPFATPSGGTSLVSLVNGHSKSGSGIGTGTGSIAPFAALKGQLTRETPQDLAKVAVRKSGKVTPFYLRENVLSVYTGKGWKPASDHGPRQPLGSALSNNPGFGGETAPRFTATISVRHLDGNPIVFAVPTRVFPLRSARWSEQDQLLLGTTVHPGESYTETVSQPDPTRAQLDAAPDPARDPQLARWLKLPHIPGLVHRLVRKLTARAGNAYERARAISDYFVNPANGFQYSLQTKGGDSGSDLVDFLKNKIGYCQQYAAAMAVMLRAAHVPARVVLGYTHGPASSRHTFTITTSDAHAWVEAYFDGIGWLAFDPTPMTGEPGASTVGLRWAPHSIGKTHSPAETSSPSAHPHHPAPAATQANKPAGSAAGPGGGGSVAGWLVPVLIVIGVVLLLLVPWFVRVERRRRRIRAGRDDPDPLWAELSDTAIDLGYIWSPTRTPRQVVRWLGDATGDAQTSLVTLAQAVEAHRYAPTRAEAAGHGPGVDLHRELRAVTARLRARRRLWIRMRAMLWPASLRNRTGRRERTNNR
jgi:transglutaminase-like putative cysteine protease